AQMESQVAETVEGGRAPPPYLPVGQLAQAMFDLGKGTGQLLRGFLSYGGRQFFNIHAISSSNRTARVVGVRSCSARRNHDGWSEVDKLAACRHKIPDLR